MLENKLLNHKDWFHTIAAVLFQVAVVLILLVIFPIADNLIVVSKAAVLFTLALMLLSLLLLRLGLTHKLKLIQSNLVTPLLLFAGAVLASNLLSAKYPVNNFLDMGGFYLGFIVVALLGATFVTKKARTAIFKIFLSATAILSILTWLQFTGYGPSWLLNQFFDLGLPDTIIFNVVGSPFIAAQVFTLALVGIVVSFFKTKKMEPLMALAGPIIAAGLFLAIWVSLPGKPSTPVILPYTASWSIALDVLRTPRSALIGVGAGNYADAFQQFKPLWMNQTPQWNILFTQGGNAAFSILTTMGLVGFLSWIFLLVKIAHEFKTHKGWLSPAGSIVIANFVLALIFPTNIIMLSLTAIFLALWMAEVSPVAHIKITSNNKQAKMLASAVAIVGGFGVLTLAYLLVIAHLSTYYVFKSTQAIINNKLVDAYQLQQKAAQLNPYIDSTRRRYASTNLTIAIALSNKTDITETERGQVNQLIQQAIREARAASVINPNNSQNWRVLANIYQNLIGVADSADQWTVNTYVNAIETAPTDPTARVALAQVFFSLQQYQQASQLFAQAVNLKPDLPNGLYGLANSLKEAGALTQAEQTYNQLLQTVDPTTDAYIQASKELQELKTRLESLSEDQTASLSAETTQNNLRPNQPSLLEQTLNQNQNQLITPPSDQLEIENNNTAIENQTSDDTESSPSGIPN